jgi:hypothetical protein
MPTWLFETEIGGRQYRWSVTHEEVVTDDGDTLEFSAGLDALVLAIGDEPAVVITDGETNWPALVDRFDGARCTIKRWTPGTTYERAVPYVFGEVTALAFGHRDAPVSFTVAAVPGSSTLGQQAPDPLARIDYTTWPVAANHAMGTQGAYYPILIGVPGCISSSVAVPCMPAPIAQWKAATYSTTCAVVAEDIEAPVSSCFVRNDDQDIEYAQTVSGFTDALGRSIRATNFAGNNEVQPSSRNSNLYVGFHTTGGGGVARDAYSVLQYLCRRFAANATDWSRMPFAEQVLSQFLVDTWISSPVNVWTWISTVLSDIPMAVRVSDRGRYVVPKRAVSDPSRRVGSVTAYVDVMRASPMLKDGPPVNEFTALCRNGFQGHPLGRVTLTGDASRFASVPGVGVLPRSSDDQLVVVAANGACAASAARYGLRQLDDPIDIDWTWDIGTVLRCLEWRAQRQAMPGYAVTYDFGLDGEGVEEGDEFLLTDEDFGWVDKVAIVDAPPVRGVGTTVQLYIPGNQ